MVHALLQCNQLCGQHFRLLDGVDTFTTSLVPESLFAPSLAGEHLSTKVYAQVIVRSRKAPTSATSRCDLYADKSPLQFPCKVICSADPIRD